MKKVESTENEIINREGRLEEDYNMCWEKIKFIREIMQRWSLRKVAGHLGNTGHFPCSNCMVTWTCLTEKEAGKMSPAGWPCALLKFRVFPLLTEKLGTGYWEQFISDTRKNSCCPQTWSAAEEQLENTEKRYVEFWEKGGVTEDFTLN